MSYRTGDGTATTSDNDYVARTGTRTFAPGETTKTITIEVKGDSKHRLVGKHLVERRGRRVAVVSRCVDDGDGGHRAFLS